MKYALQRLFQTRFCPPIELLNTSEGQKHLECCPYCIPLSVAPSPSKSTTKEFFIATEVRPNQIWKIDPDLSDWVDWRYINTPIVFITDTLDEDHVEVAPIHMEPKLALNTDVQVGKLDLFIESWNTFPILRRHLRKYVLKTDLDILAKVEEAKKIKPKPPTEVHKFFMMYEAEVASYFAIYKL